MHPHFFEFEFAVCNDPPLLVAVFLNYALQSYLVEMISVSLSTRINRNVPVACKVQRKTINKILLVLPLSEPFVPLCLFPAAFDTSV